MALLTTAEVLLADYHGDDQATLASDFRNARRLGREGRFFHMRSILHRIIGRCLS